jgi:hypothetical protein
VQAVLTGMSAMTMRNDEAVPHGFRGWLVRWGMCWGHRTLGLTRYAVICYAVLWPHYLERLVISAL